MTIQNFVGDKLSTQSLVLGKKCHLIKKQIYCLKKLNIREVYNMHFTLSVEKPTAQIYFEKNFQNLEMKWKDSV